MTALSAYQLPLSGMQLVEASAGTGKTYTLATLYLRLLLETPATVGQLLVVTYTRAATAELRERLRRRLQDALEVLEGRLDAPDDAFTRYLASRQVYRQADRRKLGEALAGFDEAAIFTIHGFCQRVLSDATLESGAPYDVTFVEDQRPLLREITDDFWANATYDAPEALVATLKRRRTTALALFEFASKLPEGEDVPVLPQNVAVPPPFDTAQWAAARGAVISVWERAEAQVTEVLLQSDALSRNAYAPASVVGKLLPCLRDLGQRRPGELAEDFERLTSVAIRRGTRKGCAVPAHELFERCAALWAFELAYRDHQSQQVLRLRREFVDYLRAERSRRKAERGLLSFDDLLSMVGRGLDGPGGPALVQRIRGRYSAALIDEFQDTDPQQYRIFHRVFGSESHSLFLIGDPKQAIYAFRGADVFAYLTAARAAEDHCHTLSFNYRSDPALIYAINLLFGRTAAPFLLKDIVYRDVEPAPQACNRVQGALAGEAPLQFLFVGDEAQGSYRGGSEARSFVVDAAATEIVALLRASSTVDGQPVAPRHVAVLCRTNNEALEMQQALLERGVPSVIEGDCSVFDAPVAEELERVLSAMAYPDDPRRLRAALATTLCAVTGADLFAMEQDDNLWEAWVDRFQRLHRLWSGSGFIQAFHRLLVEANVQEHVLSRSDGERRMTDLLHLSELLHGAAVRERFGPLSLLRFLVDMRRDREARGVVTESAQLRLESDAHAVHLTTMHKSKGLEYPVVFCPFLWSAAGLRPGDQDCLRFHDPDDGQRLKIDLGSVDHERHRALGEAETMAEALRLLYVALTRAKHRCFVFWGRFSGRFRKSALGYLLHGGDADPFSLQCFQDGLKKLDENALRQALEQLVGQSRNSIGLRPVRAPNADALSAADRAQTLRALAVEGRHDFGASLQSFSSLTSGADGIVGMDRESTVDRDKGTGQSEGSLRSVAEVPLANFPRGARAGTLIHHLYEHLDFLGADQQRVEAQARESLLRFGEDAAFAPQLAQAVLNTLQTPLDSSGFCLSHLPRRDRMDEMEFTLPSGNASQAVTVAALADVFARHARPEGGLQGYAPRLRALSPEPFFGFLRGFVDMVFRRGDRYFVVDYKSNLLGRTYDEYKPEALCREMMAHHYVLQYHLYLAALDRYLRLRVADYDYGRHMGGVMYLFVRGMSPERGLEAGIYMDRPSPAMIGELHRVLSRGLSERRA